jgi:D-alanyl-lipoteichoic acid acyltransferase DltB (MBOAT superfamily)
MLFNSAEFLFVFLPIVLAGVALLHRWKGREAVLLWLAVASVFFYGWWSPAQVPLLIGSVVANFWLGQKLQTPDSGKHGWLLTAGVALNLGLLGYYKYWHFLVTTAAQVCGQDWHSVPLELPPGISFYTFHQLTYLLQCRAGKTEGTSFRHYLLYVTFYPQLIAGPIVRPYEMLPQLRATRPRAFEWSELSVGFTLLVIGLFKKMVIADHVAAWVGPVFDQAALAGPVAMLDAWVAVLAYTFQLYFDFSAYSDMALGLALMLGVRMPANFFSPYKATSIIDFWRRWHITLSLFLRDYLYIPFGGSRKGPLRRHVNLLLVMIIGGFWHGAGWTFGLWGLWHGLCLVINHLWRQTGWSARVPRLLALPSSWALTFLAVILGWTIFRAPDLRAAKHMLMSLGGASGWEIPAGWLVKLPALAKLGIEGRSDWAVFSGPVQVATLGILLLAVLVLPNAIQLTKGGFTPPNEASLPEGKTLFSWQPGWRWALVLGILAALSLLNLGKLSEFLYFQF